MIALVEREGALVSSGVVARSDESGAFSVEGQSTGWLYAVANGYLPSTLRASDIGSDLEIVLDRGLTIAGRVVDAQGRGVADVRVVAAREGSRATWPHVDKLMKASAAAPGAWAVSDANGTFGLQGLDSGVEYLISATRAMWRSQEPNGLPKEYRVFAPAEGVTITLSPFAGLHIDVVDASTGAVVCAEVRVRGGESRGYLPAYMSSADQYMMGYSLAELGFSSTYAAYYVAAPQEAVAPSDLTDVVSVRASALGYQDGAVDVRLEYGSLVKRVLTLDRLQAESWAPMAFHAHFAQGRPFDGDLLLRLKRPTDRSVKFLPLRFVGGVAPQQDLPPGEYTASPTGVGPSCRWWPVAGPSFAFAVCASEKERVARIALLGTPVQISVRDKDGAEAQDIGISIRADGAAEPWHDPDWGLAMIAATPALIGKPRGLWLAPGRFEVAVSSGGKRIGVRSIEVDGAGLPVALEFASDSETR